MKKDVCIPHHGHGIQHMQPRNNSSFYVGRDSTFKPAAGLGSRRHGESSAPQHTVMDCTHTCTSKRCSECWYCGSSEAVKRTHDSRSISLRKTTPRNPARAQSAAEPVSLFSMLPKLNAGAIAFHCCSLSGWLEVYLHDCNDNRPRARLQQTHTSTGLIVVVAGVAACTTLAQQSVGHGDTGFVATRNQHVANGGRGTIIDNARTAPHVCLQIAASRKRRHGFHAKCPLQEFHGIRVFCLFDVLAGLGSCKAVVVAAPTHTTQRH